MALSRVEDILRHSLGEEVTLPKPQSRVEELLIELDDAIRSSSITVDTQMSPTSENAVQNKAIYNFVTDEVSTNTADFKGTYNSVSDLDNVTANNNDYAFVVDTDSSGNTVYNRYKYNGTQWGFEYALNNSSFTSAQWATIQSGLTASDKTKLDGIEAQANKTVVDSTISSGGTNPVTGDAIYTALSGKQASLTTAQLDAVNSGIDITKVAQIATNQGNIEGQQNTTASGGNGYGIINGIRLYVNPSGTPPTGDIPDGSYGLF